MTGRHDARYYLPKFTRLEERVAARATGKLRDYSRQSAGGATPKAEEKEKYYSDDPETGIPFIRVQNLSVSGELSLDDVKLINLETHHGMLARSHVGPDDLLTKITGVGRMAVSSVPPPGFQGNINQHLVRIKTKDRHTSEVLAAYLNTDIAEQLATRRATGGTRPALDYPALRSIPIIFDERILPVVRSARERRNQRLGEAAALLASIDDYLLSELGITLPPETENTLADRTFHVRAHELGGWRFDPPVHKSKFSLTSEKLDSVPLSRVCNVNPLTSFGGLHDNDMAGFVPMDAISDRLGIVEYLGERRVEECVGYTTFRDNDVLWAKITPCMENGKSAVVRGLTNGVGFGSTEFHVIRPRNSAVMPEYVHALLRMGRLRREAKRFFTGSSGHRRVDEDFLKKLIVPVPPVETQERLVQEIRARREQAIELQNAAAAELEVAKRKIEAVLLGDAA
ncbi:restriction endonuclease subunit S [Novosphingobium jiangmenense]|uniref:Restriction endonuclease subunit S n=1 Tax=Novosphingobium jiangmenense TaxID=2791981 RepID=A0ABS0HEL1_9SPHN|nr:restriction endonuclease subunit S [Novosphingobium jiangmenense]MBF9150384.1 restriction endonuclease subunit S [Novosphingobium jiangmenense]